jgi:hypothetical protein
MGWLFRIRGDQADQILALRSASAPRRQPVALISVDDDLRRVEGYVMSLKRNAEGPHSPLKGSGREKRLR